MSDVRNDLTEQLLDEIAMIRRALERLDIRLAAIHSRPGRFDKSAGGTARGRGAPTEMTEDEARTKLCHATLRPPLVAHDQPVRGALCVAANCMAWRFSYLAGDDGFCGLAGGTSISYGFPPGSATPPTEPTPS